MAARAAWAGPAAPLTYDSLDGGLGRTGSEQGLAQRPRMEGPVDPRALTILLTGASKFGGSGEADPGSPVVQWLGLGGFTAAAWVQSWN